MKRLLKRLLPHPVRHAARSAWAGFRDRLAARAELSRMKAGLRQRYGPDFFTAVAPQDEMYRTILDANGWRRVRSKGLVRYFQQGETMLAELEQSLQEVGRPLPGTRSLLEFACGHGRLTRFLRQRLGPDRITVADIDRPAVDFVRRRLAVRGFYSTREAHELKHEGRYDLVLVVSLFTHLAIDQWAPWLERLTGLLGDGGLLLFTTHGMHQSERLPPELRRRVEAAAYSFRYLPDNETRGRLPTAYYGAAWVTDSYVRGQVAAQGLGRVLASFPGRVQGVQDLYVVQRRAGEPQAGLPPAARAG
jgi:SAM-dependent methyltransferase